MDAIVGSSITPNATTNTNLIFPDMKSIIYWKFEQVLRTAGQEARKQRRDKVNELNEMKNKLIAKNAKSKQSPTKSKTTSKRSRFAKPKQSEMDQIESQIKYFTDLADAKLLGEFTNCQQIYDSINPV